MSSKKEEKAQAAAEKIKAQALSAAKGLSRAQAERAATAAARNVNAYGQKEEGPSRWQERKEAKRQMYLMSTEKAVRLGERKDPKASSSAAGAGASQCQKCLQSGHWTYECKNERVYITRPSRSQQLKNPARTKLVVSFEGNSDVQRRLEQEDEKAGKEKSSKDNGRRNSKRKHRSKSYSESETSEASVFESGSSSQSDSESDYSSEETSSSYSSSDSGYRRQSRKKKPQKKRRHRRYTSSSSDSSESDSASDSDSDSDRGSRRKARRNGKRR